MAYHQNAPLPTSLEWDRDRYHGRMPTYEYACADCGEHIEVVQSFQDEPLTTCPRCGGPLRKVFGNIGIVFKGSGFYKTDTRQAVSGSTRAASGGESRSDQGDSSLPGAGSGDGASAPPEKSTGGSTAASASSGGDSAKPKAPAASAAGS